MTNVDDVLNSQSVVETVKKLWPSMLFLIVMTLISYGGIFFVKSSISATGFAVCIYTWFAACLLCMGLGFFIVLTDSKGKLTQKMSNKK